MKPSVNNTATMWKLRPCMHRNTVLHLLYH